MILSAPETGARGWKRIDGIDLLRGLSIFFVLIRRRFGVGETVLGAALPEMD